MTFISSDSISVKLDDEQKFQSWFEPGKYKQYYRFDLEVTFTNPMASGEMEPAI